MAADSKKPKAPQIRGQLRAKFALGILACLSPVTLLVPSQALAMSQCQLSFDGSKFSNEMLNQEIMQRFPNLSPELRAYVTPEVGMFDLMKAVKAQNLPPDLIDARNSWLMSEHQQRTQSTLQGQGLTFEEASKLLNETRNHPVVGMKALDVYDPIVNGQRSLGFCYGRSEYIHLRLRKMGIGLNAITKLFQMGDIFGDPSFGGPDHPWPYHMVTIVKAKDSKAWYALDPFLDKPVTATEWVRLNRLHATDAQHPPIAYLADPRRALAAGMSDLPVDVLGFQHYMSPNIPKYYTDMYNSPEFGGPAAVTELLSR